MIGDGYTGFLESVSFDTGYRRACSDILEILERAEWTRIIKREGMELLRILCVPENLEAVATGDADLFVRHSSKAKDGKERFYLERRINKAAGKCA